MTKQKFKKAVSILAFIISVVLSFASCEDEHILSQNTTSATESTAFTENVTEHTETTAIASKTVEETKTTAAAETTTESSQPETTKADKHFSFSDIPEYSGAAYVVVNDNEPFFTKEEIESGIFEYYGDLDSFGRCTLAFAHIDKSLMPTEKRGNISSVKPSGWQTVEYVFVDGHALYNRCHLIGYQLTAENANEKNLITGTRYLNTVGMLPFENMIADYLKETNGRVLYRVRPYFKGNDQLATGILLEALSTDDGGEGVCFNVFAYNVQPFIDIDYSTGDSKISDDYYKDNVDGTYVINRNTKKIHLPSCEQAENIKAENKETLICSRQALLAQGFTPCKNCNP